MISMASESAAPEVMSRMPAVTETPAAPPNLAAARESSRQLERLLRAENGAMVEFLLALVEFDGLRSWEDLGFGSLFDYLHRELRMSTGAAFYRKTAVRLLRSFPEVVETLRDGRLCVSVLPDVAKVLARENIETVLPQFFHRSAREAKEVAAALSPRVAAPHRDVVTVVAPRVSSPALVPVPALASTTSVGASGIPSEHLGPASGAMAAAGAVAHGLPISRASASPPPSDEPVAFALTAPPTPASTDRGLGQPRPGAPEPEPDVIEPLTANLRRLHITVSRAFLQKLDAARALLSHRYPAGRATDVLETALDLLLDRHVGQLSARRRRSRKSRPASPASVESAPLESAPATPESEPELKRARASTPDRKVKPASSSPAASAQRESRSPSPPARIPDAVRRAVLERDEGRCQFRLHDGSVCGSKTRIEVDHVTPKAMNGPPTMANLRALCKLHNQLAARRFFGEAFIEQVRWRKKKKKVRPGGALPSASRRGQDRGPR